MDDATFPQSVGKSICSRDRSHVYANPGWGLFKPWIPWPIGIFRHIEQGEGDATNRTQFKIVARRWTVGDYMGCVRSRGLGSASDRKFCAAIDAGEFPATHCGARTKD
jgi:hypothetical protein